MKLAVTFVLPVLNLSGGSRVVFDYAARLLREGHEVRVIVPRPRRASIKEHIRSIFREQKLARTNVPTVFHGSDSKVPIIQGKLPGRLSIDDFPDADIIIATWWETAEWISSLPMRKGKKIHFVQGHEVFPYLPVERVKAVYNLPWPKLVVSEWLKETLISNYNNSDIFLVKNGIDTSRFSTHKRKMPPYPKVGMLWSNAETKNARMGVDAIARAKLAIPELRAILFGSTPPPPELANEKWITYIQAPDQIEIPRIYSSCSAWLVPSIEEGFGLPILEAMAMGTPVVSTAAGAARDLINGVNGILVECSIDSMKDAILTILLEPEEEWCARSSEATAVAATNNSDVSFLNFLRSLEIIAKA